MSSLRRRVLIPITLGAASILVVGALAAHRSVSHTLREATRASLEQRARWWASQLELAVTDEARAELQTRGALALTASGDRQAVESARAALLGVAARGVHVELATKRSEAVAPGASGGWWHEIVAGDGRVLTKSIGTIPANAITVEVTDVPFADARYQAVWKALRADHHLPGHAVRVRVGSDTSDVEAFLGALRVVLAVLVVAMIVALGGLALLATRAGLRPLSNLGEQIQTLDVAEPTRRVRLDPCPAELQPVVAALNGQLDRLQDVLARERRVSAHVAHELRTPLAEVRTLVDVALASPDDMDLAQDSLLACRDAAGHLTQVVEAVLRVARLRARDARAPVTAVDLQAVLECAVSECARAAGDPAPHVAHRGADGLVVQVDADSLHTALLNVLTNAVQHGSAGHAIDVEARQVSERTAIATIANDCEGLAPEDLNHVAEPFWRKDEARTVSRQGGLGLTLAAEAARVGGFDLRFTLEGGRFVAILEMPLGAAPDR